MYKAVRNKPLTGHQVKFNKIVSQTRFKVERTFGGIFRWFKTGLARYVGKDKTHTQHLMEAIKLLLLFKKTTLIIKIIFLPIITQKQRRGSGTSLLKTS
jgi:hypothetical protein